MQSSIDYMVHLLVIRCKPIQFISKTLPSSKPGRLTYDTELAIIFKTFLVNEQRDAQTLFYVFISIYNSLHVSSTSCSSSGETNFINTTSGNSHTMLVAELCAG